MRGNELTESQIQSARSFIVKRHRDKIAQISDDQPITIKFGDLARLVAWYGAVRYVAGRDGVGGSLEAPGEMVEKKPAEVAPKNAGD